MADFNETPAGSPVIVTGNAAYAVNLDPVAVEGAAPPPVLEASTRKKMSWLSREPKPEPPHRRQTIYLY